MGEKALYNYASIACDVAVGQGTLCVDTHDNLRWMPIMQMNIWKTAFI